MGKRRKIEGRQMPISVIWEVKEEEREMKKVTLRRKAEAGRGGNEGWRKKGRNKKR